MRLLLFASQFELTWLPPELSIRKEVPATVELPAAVVGASVALEVPDGAVVVCFAV